MTSNQKHLNQFKTLIYEEELDNIAGWVEEYPHLETGGDLFGFWTYSGFPVVQFVLGPGKTSKHNTTSFFQDTEHLIKAGETLRNKHGLQHIGAWHSHHQMDLAQPSGGDERTVFNALRQYSLPRFLLCIANLHPESTGHRNKYTVNIGCFLFSPSSPQYQTGSWVVLPGKSPIRNSSWGMNRNEKEIFSLPNRGTKKSWDVPQTTLEEQPLVTTEPLERSEELWYTLPQGQALLKNLQDRFQTKFQNFKISRKHSTQEMYISFEFNINQNNNQVDKWRIDFPNDFPQSLPSMEVNFKPCDLITNWKPNAPILQIENKIEEHYTNVRN
ncbi:MULTISPECIES: hypothetical protein [Spirulina sp. CCY15215]|uniref:hypothetical protein n=1 Tax=Spirulina sp. CCY15215 TaxID=2767591 RepID=UPI00195132C4|nr:hypothetical protein [Spirulina major]